MFFQSRRELKIQNNVDYIVDNGYENAKENYVSSLNLDSTADAVNAVKKSETIQISIIGLIVGLFLGFYFMSLSAFVGGVIMSYAVLVGVKLARVLFIWNVVQRD